MNKANEAITTLTSTIKTIKETYESNRQLIRQKEQETQDFLHEIEFGNLTTRQKSKTVKELQKIRRDRRRMKEENEALEPLYKITNHKAFDWFKTELEKAQTQISRVIETQALRAYKPKVRTDLTIGSEHYSVDEGGK